MPVTKAITGNVYKHLGSTIAYGGTGGSNVNSLNVKDLSKPSMAGNRNTVVTSGKAKGVTAGTLGKMAAGYYTLMGFTPKIGNVASTVLLNPGNEAAVNRSSNFRNSVTTTRFVTAGWNYKTGQPLTNPTTATDSWGPDVAPTTGRRPYTAGKVTFTASSPARSQPLSSQILRQNYENKTG